MNISWLIVLLMVYLLPLALFAFLLYKLYNIWQKGLKLEYDSIPNLKQVTSRNLPLEMTKQLDEINAKAKKLLHYYQDGQISDQAIIGENQFLVKKILDTHLPEAIADYQRLDSNRADQMAVGATGKTAKQLLSEYLTTINQQFDTMLDAMYEQNAQKLLATNRYLQSRFDTAPQLVAPTIEQNPNKKSS